MNVINANEIDTDLRGHSSLHQYRQKVFICFQDWQLRIEMECLNIHCIQNGQNIIIWALEQWNPNSRPYPVNGLGEGVYQKQNPIEFGKQVI